MRWLFCNKQHTSYKEQQGQKVRHIPFDKCGFGSNDGWSWETNSIVGHQSGYVVVGKGSGCFFLFIRWVLAIRAVVEWASTESLSLVTIHHRQHSGKYSECWNSWYMKQQENDQWWFQSYARRSGPSQITNYVRSTISFWISQVMNKDGSTLSL